MRRIGATSTALLAAMAVALAGGLAYAAVPDSNGTIHGCYQSGSGALRVVDADVGGKCKPNEKPLDWNAGGGGSNTLFANVAADGTLVSGNATSAAIVDSPFYDVSFGRDISRCAATANPGLIAGQSDHGRRAFAIVDVGTDYTGASTPSVVHVSFVEPGVGAAQTDFHLVVAC
jgi:hypothetical protein